MCISSEALYAVMVPACAYRLPIASLCNNRSHIIGSIVCCVAPSTSNRMVLTVSSDQTCSACAYKKTTSSDTENLLQEARIDVGHNGGLADGRTLLGGACVFRGVSGQCVHVPDSVISSPLPIPVQHRRPLLLGLLRFIPAPSRYCYYKCML